MSNYSKKLSRYILELDDAFGEIEYHEFRVLKSYLADETIFVSLYSHLLLCLNSTIETTN